MQMVVMNRGKSQSAKEIAPGFALNHCRASCRISCFWSKSTISTGTSCVRLKLRLLANRESVIAFFQLHSNSKFNAIASPIARPMATYNRGRSLEKKTIWAIDQDTILMGTAIRAASFRFFLLKNNTTMGSSRSRVSKKLKARPIIGDFIWW